MDVIGACRRHELPVFKSGCPADGVTKREEMKELVRKTVKIYPDFKAKVLTALKTKETQKLW